MGCNKNDNSNKNETQYPFEHPSGWVAYLLKFKSTGFYLNHDQPVQLTQPLGGRIFYPRIITYLFVIIRENSWIRRIIVDTQSDFKIRKVLIPNIDLLMMKALLLNILYLFLLVVYLPVLIYCAVYYGKYRAGFKERFFGRIIRRRKVVKGTGEREYVVWFHAVSVGEVRLLRPLLQMIRERQPDWCCVISTTSRTGMEVAIQSYGKDWKLFYCPLDFSWSVETAMSRLQPDLLVLAEQEFWPNLIDAAKRHGVKVAVINGRFGESGYRRYLWIRPFVASMLRKLDVIAVQSATYAGWFHHLGASTDAIHITGSMKFDGVSFDRDNSETSRLRLLAGILPDDVVFVAGSTQSPEELFAVECYNNLKLDFPNLRLIIVPRHEERFDEVAKLLEATSQLWERRSLLSEANCGNGIDKNFDNKFDRKNRNSNADEGKKVAVEIQPIEGGSTNKSVRPRILLVDKMGELGAWWGTAAIAFVGGSIGTRGGQNMIEPAAYGAAVCFGPNTKNFRDIVDLLLRAKGAKVIHDKIELENFIRNCLESKQLATELGNNAKKLVKEQLGATERTLELLKNLLTI
ncbi:MAG: 3-deoxy-D-manno-octulosonic acid transferase [Planctomycetaceae bacterium]|jgi:3-deoxy-D-manno-octulosonic-acid transferase|nr:3-deoxy-D-manno-octulosonic acid transferase [Planctomycetaceae bacterium]